MNKYIILLLLTASSFAFGQNKVGVNTEEPQASLDVNGNVIVSQLDPYSPNNIDLMRNTENKRIVGVAGNPPFIKVTFKITCTDNQDWIADFNTLIPTKDYTLAVLNASLKYPKYEETTGSKEPYNGGNWDNAWNTFYGISHLGDNTTNGNLKETVNPQQVVEVTQGNDGFWHLSADYVKAVPALSWNVYYGYTKGNRYWQDLTGLYWEITTMAIHNSYVKDFRGDVIAPYGGFPSEANQYTISVTDTNPVINEIVSSVN